MTKYIELLCIFLSLVLGGYAQSSYRAFGVYGSKNGIRAVSVRSNILHSSSLSFTILAGVDKNKILTFGFSFHFSI